MIAGKQAGLVPDGIRSRDPHPHLQVWHHPRPAVEASDVLVRGPLDDDGRRLDVNDGQELVGGVAQDTGRGLEELGRALVTARVDVQVTAEGGADFGVVVEGLLHGAVEAVADGVVAVEDVDEVAAGAFDAAVQVAGLAEVFGLAVEVDAFGGELVDDRLRVVAGAVVDDLDLDLLGAGVLGENARERLAGVWRGVVGGHHHRPEWTVRARRESRDLRRPPTLAAHRVESGRKSALPRRRSCGESP